MNAFFNILQECAGIKNKKYPNQKDFSLFSNTRKNCIKLHSQIDCILYKLYDRYCDNLFDYTKKGLLQKASDAKIGTFSYAIVKNSYLFFKERHEIDQMIDLFYKAQKCYYGFLLLVKIYRKKKYPIIVKDDLMLNPLERTNHTTFELVQTKTIYLFAMRDLMNIIETSLSNACSFFPEPLVPKNPYNNISFSNSEIINIYLKSINTQFRSQLLYNYISCHFDLKMFELQNEALLREMSIKRFVYKSPVNVLFTSINNMLQTNSYTRYLKIHKDFPCEKLVHVFRPYLYYDYIVNYDIQHTNKTKHFENILYRKLKQFYLFNPNFGKRMAKIENSFVNSKKEKEKEFIFNDDHINFYGKIIKNIKNGMIKCGDNYFQVELEQQEQLPTPIQLTLRTLINMREEDYEDDYDNDEHNSETHSETHSQHSETHSDHSIVSVNSPTIDIEHIMNVIIDQMTNDSETQDTELFILHRVQ
jgi:hypothetical protein